MGIKPPEQLETGWCKSESVNIREHSVYAGNSVDTQINEITNFWHQDEPKSITNILQPCKHLFMPENIEINISEIDL